MTEIETPEDGDIVFELCAESLQACRIARSAGAARIELCANLAVDGLTPDLALTRAAVQESGLPVFTLLRPRAGNFAYTAAEFATLRHDLVAARVLGVQGFALGVLLPNGHIDIERTRDLVDLAAPLDVTFHRAFDATPDLAAALEQVIATGCRRVLTSGGAADVVAGTDSLAALVRQANGRITIAAGGGIRAENARALARQTGARHFHGSLRHAAAAVHAQSAPGQAATNGRASAAHPAGTSRPSASLKLLSASVVPSRPSAPSVPSVTSVPLVPPASIDPQAIRHVVDELRHGFAERQTASRTRSPSATV